MKRFFKTIRPYLLSVLLALAVGGLSAWVTRGAMARFETLQKPPLAPPGWLFPVVWTILYTLMGVSAALIWRTDRLRQTCRLCPDHPSSCRQPARRSISPVRSSAVRHRRPRP